METTRVSCRLSLLKKQEEIVFWKSLGKRYGRIFAADPGKHFARYGMIRYNGATLTLRQLITLVINGDIM